MKKYTISIWEEQSGYFTVEAKSKKEAEKIIFNKVNGAGIDEVSKKYNFDVMHREVNLLK